MSRKEKQRLFNLRQEAWFLQKGRCYYCKKPIDLEEPRTGTGMGLSAEHLTPKSEGGKNVKGNIVAAHARCNQKVEQYGTYALFQYKEP